MAAIVFDKLTKSFPGLHGKAVHALRDFTLEVDAGELLVLVGPSGSGKTTLLRLIAGLDDPTAGTISIDGRLVNSVPPHEREVAMAFQDHTLYPHLNVGDNLGFGLKLRKFPGVEINRRTAEVAEWLGLTALLARMPATLSGGERQRVALGRAMVIHPKVLLLDEPLSNLDAPLRGQLRREIGRLHRRLKGTTLYVTHDQMEAMSLANRLVVLRDGVIQQTGRPLDVYERPRNLFVAGFIGAPPMNLFEGVLEAEWNILWFRGAKGPHSREARLNVSSLRSWPESLSAYLGQRVTLGLRPEDIRLEPPGGTTDGPAAVVRATIELIECTGPEKFLYLRANQEAVTARASANHPARLGETIHIAFDVRRAHIFSSDGLAIH